MSKRLDTSNTNNIGVSKEDAKLPFKLSPLTSADLTTVSHHRSNEDNRIDWRGDKKLPATQTSFQIQKPCKTDAIVAKSKAKGQLAKNAPATTNSKAASMYTKYVEDDEGSPALKDCALTPTQKQNVTSASSQFYIEKLAIDAQSRNRTERKTFRRTNKNTSAVSNHQRIVNYVRKKKLPISNRKERKAFRKAKKHNSAVSNHQRIVNYARSKMKIEKKLRIPHNTAKTNSDDVDVSQGDEGRGADRLQESSHENDRVSRPGAFAVSGIGDESGNNTWESTEDLQSEVDDSMIEDESEHFATVVDNETLHEKFRKYILTNEVTIAANVVPTDEYLKKEKRQCLLWACGVLSVLGTVIGVSIGLTRTNESASTTSEFPSASPTLVLTRTKIPTLDTIQNNGKVRCGIGYYASFETDLVRGVFFSSFSQALPSLPSLRVHCDWKVIKNRILPLLCILFVVPCIGRSCFRRPWKD